MKQLNAVAGLLIVLSCCGAALAQTPDGSPIALPPVTAAPLPLLSTSGRFSSLNPPGQDLCGYGDVTGHVVSTHLILGRSIRLRWTGRWFVGERRAWRSR